MFATVDGAARQRTVALTENAKTGAATQQGLKPSDPMVQLPTDAISDGAPIRVRWNDASGLIDVALFAAGFVSWAISTLAAGGGSVLIVAAVAAILRGQAIAPVVTMTSVLASPARMILLWRFINWRVVRWYLPGATTGALLGGWTFAHIGTQWLQIVLAMFLISTAWQYRMGARPSSFTMPLPWFVPVSFVSGLTSAVVGASGLLVNPFYLNYGLMKEAMLATRAVNSLAIQLVKIGAYAVFGVLHWRLARHGLTAGAGAIAAIWLVNPWLQHLSSFRFRQFAVFVMLFGGLLILWQQRALVTALLGVG